MPDPPPPSDLERNRNNTPRIIRIFYYESIYIGLLLICNYDQPFWLLDTPKPLGTELFCPHNLPNIERDDLTGCY